MGRKSSLQRNDGRGGCPRPQCTTHAHTSTDRRIAMTKSRYLSILTAAALVGAAPAWAQTTAPHTIAPKPLCSELGHPNAGKLADKSTGKAKEKSASPVHQDCTPDPRTPQA